MKFYTFCHLTDIGATDSIKMPKKVLFIVAKYVPVIP